MYDFFDSESALELNPEVVTLTPGTPVYVSEKTQYLKNLYNYYFVHLDSCEVDIKCVETANILDRKHFFSLLHGLQKNYLCVCVCVCVSRTVNVAELLLHFICSSLSKNTLMSSF